MNNPFPLHVKTIGIAAPASGADRSRYEASRKLLDSFGIRIIEGKHLFETPAPDTPAYLSASDDARAEPFFRIVSGTALSAANLP